MQVSVLIPARNEQFLKKTIDDILSNVRGDTEIIAVLDGAWAEPPIPDHERVTLIYHSESIGQRAATNEAAKMSTAEFIMKADAHCAFDEGFDVKLMADCEHDWTVVPRMYNLHVFDWQCGGCGNRIYQGPTPTKCEKCNNTADFERVMVWKPKPSPETDFMRFDSDLKFQYWSGYKKRPEAKGDICDLMSCLGACWFMRRDRYWELDGLDENHGSWGQMGTEISAKSHLSGGRLVINKHVWFSHMFRTQGGDFGFPYKIHGSEQKKARKYSRDLWLNNKWPKAIRPLSWLLEKYWPVPDWSDEDLAAQKERESKNSKMSAWAKEQKRIDGPTKGIVFYTDNRVNLKIAHAVQKRLRKISQESGIPIVSASLKPMPHFGAKNVHLKGHKRGPLTMFKQILAGLEASDAEIIFFAEHDVLYHKSHFVFVPLEKDVFYYNVHVWKLRATDGHALKVDDCKQTSGLCAYRELLIEHYRERIRRVEAEGFSRKMGFEPGTHGRKERVDDHKADSWESECANIDIRHEGNLTPSRWTKAEFRSQRYTKGWQESNEVPGWGQTKGRFREFLRNLNYERR